ncbi:hypothetical protein NPIL_637731 [Nephila pilipes]|uniref:Uncharacterized protein n=1 Tax=Nephila pilipes TaxID=299642 RepID=A0A8X6PZ11_NEPPI|nr:hypothetical protein NPIL_637731 [Nephila pilipes]
MLSILSVAKLFVFFSILCLTFGNNCPPPRTILPCTCDESLSTSYLCENITSAETFFDIIENTGGLSFNMLFVHNSVLQYLPTSAIISENFKFLAIRNTELDSLFDKPPTGKNSLDKIVLDNVTLHRNLQWDLFKGLTKLSRLEIYKTEVKSLGNDFKLNISPNLRFLLMDNTNTMRLSKDAFENLNVLSGIVIKSSHIKVLKRSMFPKPAAIESLAFMNNKIEFLPDDIFSDMPKLWELIFSSNKISILKESIFKDFSHHYCMLNVYDNPIKCGCELQWIVQGTMLQISGECQDPEFRKGKRIESLMPNDFGFC